MKTLFITNARGCFCVWILTFLVFGSLLSRANSGNSADTISLNQPVATSGGQGVSAPLTTDIDNQGNIVIKGDLVNLNVAPLDLGPGTIEFSGTSPQTPETWPSSPCDCLSKKSR